MDYEECYNRGKVKHESKIKHCYFCKYIGYCVNCVPEMIDFNVVKFNVCEKCVCDPDDECIRDKINILLKDFDITKRYFLEILKAEKTIKYDFAYFINKLNVQINRLNNKILKEEDIINELKTKLQDAVKNLRLIEKLRLLSN